MAGSSLLRRSLLLTLLLALSFASPLHAQSIVDARRVEFTPSVDNNAVDSNGVALVARYSMQIFVAGGSTAVQTLDLGKPAPDLDGMIRVDFVALLPTPLINGVIYEALVEAVGPGGSSGGTRTNTFAFGSTCSRAVSPTSQSFTGAGGNGSTSVTTGAGCTWTAVSNSNWIAVTSGATGSGNGTVGFSVAANTVASTRTGTLTIAGATFTVTQSAASCTASVSPTSQSFSASAGTASASVTVATGCPWTAVSNVPWITVTAGATGSASGAVTFDVAANTVASSRTGTLTIAGATFTVTQAAAACSPSILPTSQSFTAAAGSGSSTVAAATGCGWTAASNAAWITVTGGATGSGNGAVTFDVATNTVASSRTGTLTIAGATFTVTQAAASCSPSISPTSQSYTAAAASGSSAVTVATGCNWTAVSNTPWITITSGATGSGNGSVTFDVGANTVASSRTGTLTIAGGTFTVTQAAASCSPSLSPAGQAVGASGGTGSSSVTIATGCAWTASSNASWITVTSGATGSGNGTVGFSVAANTVASNRSGTLTIAGATFTVTQAPAACSPSISPASQSFAASGGSGSSGVTVATGCAWTAVSNASWITLTGGATGSGNGSVTFSVAANSVAAARTGTLTIAGATFAVTQAAASCSPSISPASQSFSASGGSSSSAVTVATGCAWTAASNASWIVVTSGATGSGNGATSFTVAANPDASPRTGTLSIAGTTFTVTQAAAACSPAISPTAQSFTAAGGSSTSAVTAATGCSWTAASNAAWITVTGGASGSGNGSVTFTVAANTVASSRTGTLTIAGATFTVTQLAAGCAPSVSPTSQSFTAAGGTGSGSVTVATGCSWSAGSNASWITVTSGATGSGNGTVGFSVAANTVASTRTGTMTIAGATFTVTQAAASCSPSISPTTQSVTASGGSGSSSVTVATGCSWTATSNASWITVTSGASGSGNGSVTFDTAPNTVASIRTGTLTIAGVTFAVTQAAATCSPSLSPTGQFFAATAGSGSSSVSAATGCAWTAVSNAPWITVTSGATGSGNGTVGFSLAANSAASTRTGTLTIAGATFTVTQDAASCSPSISPTTQSFAAAAGTGSSVVTAATGCAWAASSNASWISITGGAAGSGNGSVTFAVAANTGSGRTGTLTIAGATFTVSQAGNSCSPAVSPTTQSFPDVASTGRSTVTVAAGCPWTAVSNNVWITVTSGGTGSGNGSVTFDVAANTTTWSRTGSLTIAGTVFNVTQAGPCAPAISPTTQSFNSSGGAGSSRVTAAPWCTWTAVSNSSWITVNGGASGTGDGTVSFSVGANNSASSRTGSLTIAGTTFTVSQLANGASCTASTSPTSQSFTDVGGSASATVTIPAGCPWTAVSNNVWITVTGGAAGSGNGSVTFDVAANTGSSRTGTLTVAGNVFTVTQAPSSCRASSTTSQWFTASGGTGTGTVTAPGGCPWTAVSNNVWITITSGAAGSGNGSVSFDVAPNTTTWARTGSLMIAGTVFSIDQEGPCAPVLSPTNQSFGPAGTVGAATVNAAYWCTWTAVSNSDWITVTSGASGIGTGSVSFSVSANNSSGNRTGTLTIAGKTFTVSQQASGTACTGSLSPSSQSFTTPGGNGSTSVTAAADCPWTAVSNDNWITVTSGASGTGSGPVTFSVAANTASSRTGTLTIAGATMTVTQAASSCSPAISPTSQSFMAAGGNGSSTVTATTGCPWTAVSNNPWITVTSGASGAGNGMVAFTVAANNSSGNRTGSLTIAGTTFSVSQLASGTSCTPSTSPTSQSFTASGGNGTSTVTVTAGCPWTAVSNNAWITVTSGASGSGNGTVSFTVDPNTTTWSRLGSLTIAGTVFTVNQGGPCAPTISPTTQSFSSGAGVGSSTVTAADWCSWTAVSNNNWITVTAGASGTGNGPVSFSVGANNTTSSRTGSLTIAGATFTINQLASNATCSYTVSPTSLMVAGSPVSGTIAVTTQTGCAWSVSTNATWIIISGSGSGSGSVSYTIAQNDGTTSRSGTITIGGQIVSVMQAPLTKPVPPANLVIKR